jgi:thymidylate kinase
MIIAVIGGDGAGKSTLVKAFGRWLSADFDVLTMHLGKPVWSRTTMIVRGLLKTGRTLGFWPRVRAANVTDTRDGTRASSVGFPQLLQKACQARDRYLAYRTAQRFAIQGGIVVCDRFPIPSIRSMDGPLAVDSAGAPPDGRLVNFLLGLEQSYYRRILAPELLIVLKVDPEIAVQRKTGENSAHVRNRNREIWAMDFRALNARVIDASQPQAEVLSQLKTHVWSAL